MVNGSVEVLDGRELDGLDVIGELDGVVTVAVAETRVVRGVVRICCAVETFKLTFQW